MTEWLRFGLVLSGLTYLVTQSAILSPLRRFVGSGPVLLAVFVYCAACVGFWVALVLGIAGLWPPGHGSAGWALEAAVAGCGLMAMWGRLMPAGELWDLEQGWREYGTKEEESEHDGRSS